MVSRSLTIDTSGKKELVYVTASLNSLGFRSSEVEHNKSHILLVGDSVAWGFGLQDNATISHYLNELVPEYQMLNLGVMGYSIDQYYLFLKRTINQTHPKYVFIMVYSGNDKGGTISNSGNGKSKPLYRWKDNQLVLTNTPISRNSCANLWSSSFLLTKLEAAFPAFNNLIGILCPTKVLDETEGKRVIKQLFLEINKLVKEHNATAFFILSPEYKDFPVPRSDLAYFDDILKQSNVSYIDLYGLFMKNVAYHDLDYVFSDVQGGGGHYSKNGSELVAKVLKEMIKRYEQDIEKKAAVRKKK